MISVSIRKIYMNFWSWANVLARLHSNYVDMVDIRSGPTKYVNSSFSRFVLNNNS